MNEELYKDLLKDYENIYGPILEGIVTSFRERNNLTYEEYEKFCEWSEKQ